MSFKINFPIIWQLYVMYVICKLCQKSQDCNHCQINANEDFCTRHLSLNLELRTLSQGAGGVGGGWKDVGSVVWCGADTMAIWKAGGRWGPNRESRLPPHHTHLISGQCLRVCVCVCVCLCASVCVERERETERDWAQGILRISQGDVCMAISHISTYLSAACVYATDQVKGKWVEKWRKHAGQWQMGEKMRYHKCVRSYWQGCLQTEVLFLWY